MGKIVPDLPAVAGDDSIRGYPRHQLEVLGLLAAFLNLNSPESQKESQEIESPWDFKPICTQLALLWIVSGDEWHGLSEHSAAGGSSGGGGGTGDAGSESLSGCAKSEHYMLLG
eukprot:CAMPEP_0170468554 /NCGR_PEP_ID=MMETSP0123-20130129/11690_1 /TAXON_ID=182087 /ORGANISM="Favella ehrenbergii, Strain Fehren 1" /LENGTH=113 /DNA_ID=CAMNT_0010735151 /DNA_START=787 /DNA_END=1129 /DNA_ORIENTATION=+